MSKSTTLISHEFSVNRVFLVHSSVLAKMINRLDRFNLAFVPVDKVKDGATSFPATLIANGTVSKDPYRAVVIGILGQPDLYMGFDKCEARSLNPQQSLKALVAKTRARIIANKANAPKASIHRAIRITSLKETAAIIRHALGRIRIIKSGNFNKDLLSKMISRSTPQLMRNGLPTNLDGYIQLIGLDIKFAALSLKNNMKSFPLDSPLP